MYEEDLKDKPVVRLQQIHNKLDEEKAKTAQRKEEDFEDSKEVLAETERWVREEQDLKAANVNQDHLRGRQYIHNETLRKLRVQFDDGELTPSTVHEAPPTDLEMAKANLDKAVVGMNEVVAKGKELLSR